MYNSRRVLAVIPARGGSKGIPRKNIRPLAGKPLVAWSIEQALASHAVDRVIVSTEDEEIAEVARRAGADVPFLRPADIAQDASPVAAAILHAIDTLEAQGDRYDVIVLLECTSPARYPGDVDRAVATLVDAAPAVGSVVGMIKLTHEHPAWTFRVEDGTMVNYNQRPLSASLSQRQALDDAYLPYSLYASWTTTFREHKLFYQPRTAPLFLPREQMVEIDDDVDVVIAEAIMRRYFVSLW